MRSNGDIGTIGTDEIERWAPGRRRFGASEATINHSGRIIVLRLSGGVTIIDFNRSAQNPFASYRHAAGTNIPQTDQIKRDGNRCCYRNESEAER